MEPAHRPQGGDAEIVSKELAPTGRLRVGVVFAPAVSTFFVALNADGHPRGVTVDLGNALASTLDVPVDFLAAPNSGELADAVEKGSIDVAFMPVDEERRRRVDFGPAYFLIESTALVHGDSTFRSAEDLNRPDVRVVGIANTTTIRSATQILRTAMVVAVSSVEEAIGLLGERQADAVTLSRDVLATYRARIPGSRILEGRLHETGIAIAVPRGRPVALAYVSSFLENAKASGVVRRAFDRFGLQSEVVAPAERGRND